jgi:hypothetical protein
LRRGNRLDQLILLPNAVAFAKKYWKWDFVVVKRKHHALSACAGEANTALQSRVNLFNKEKGLFDGDEKQ